MKKKITLLAGALCLCSLLKAQQPLGGFLKNTEISGYADIFYKYDFDKTGDNTKTSFTVPDNSIEPAMLTLKLVHTTGKFSATADLGFGSKVEDFNYAENNSKVLLKQLFIDYRPTENFTLTAGSWTTHIGYELLDAPDNDIYSMSYAFSNGPFFHTGIKANYAKNGFNFMAGVDNPNDLKSSFNKIIIYDDNGNIIGRKNYYNKFIIWQAGYSKEKWSLYLNGLHGSYNPLDNNISQYDFVASYELTGKFKLGANATFSHTTYDSSDTKKDWYSLVLYAKYRAAENVALNYRGEYLDNKDGVLSLGQAAGNTVFANTFSATITSGNFQLKPELRFESASEPIYHKSNGDTKKSSANFLVGAMYSF